MKIFKIILVVIVVTAIGAGIFFWMQSLKGPEKVKAPESAFTKKVEGEIEQLKVKPDNKFCRDYYNQVAYHINEFYKQDRLGNNQSENDQWKVNLESNLYSAYVEKFIKQAKTVFRNSEWKPDDLRFIQTEMNELKRSNLLVAESPVDKEFTTILTALNKYDEVVSFISSSKGYGYSNTDLSARFPIADVQSKISRATLLPSKRLENEFVNNCSRLHDGLKEIPQSLFRVHVRYLDSKISNWSGMFSNYNSQSDYANNLYKPLKAEIDELDNTIYNVSNFDSEYNRLTKKMNDDSSQATRYFLNKNK